VQFIEVAVNGDTTIEPDETFQVQLSSPVGATLLKGTGTATIFNDDFPPVNPWYKRRQACRRGWR